jgi:hypothetical protein
MGSFSVRKNMRPLREVVALSDYEFLESESWHTFALRTGLPDTSIDRRTRAEG